MTRYHLVCLRIGEFFDSYTVEDPEIRGGYLYAQFIKRPHPKSRMCKQGDIVCLTIEEDRE